MTQARLFSEVPQIVLPSKTLLSWYDDEDFLMAAGLRLYNRGRGVAIDPTYSEGRVWKGLPAVFHPTHKSDIFPQVEGVTQADCRHLPYDDNSLDGEYLDLPFQVGRSKSGIMMERFSKIPTMAMLEQLYYDAIVEAYRVLMPKSLLIIKYQNCVSSGRKHDIAGMVRDATIAAGFTFVDEAILIRYNPLPQYHMYKKNGQHHFKAAHCQVRFLRKGKLGMKEQQARARAAAQVEVMI